MKIGGVKVVVAQAWGGRSRNEFAASQLAGGRKVGGMKEGAYVLLNFDNKVCAAYARPVRDAQGRCQGGFIAQEEPGGRWQVRQGLAAVGDESSKIRFMAVDVEWFAQGAPSADADAQALRRQYILDALDEVKRHHLKAVVYTRNAKGHWRSITGCDDQSVDAQCVSFRDKINTGLKVALWDVETGDPTLRDFRPYGVWSQRSGRQYQLDRNMFGLPPNRTVDLNVFDLSLLTK
jgi:hypothetical protein